MSLAIRNFLILSAIGVSLLSYTLGVIFSNALSWHEHHECLKKFQLNSEQYYILCPPPGGIPKKYIIGPETISPSEQLKNTDNDSNNNTVLQTFFFVIAIFFLIALHPFMSIPLLCWFLWHRKTIKNMGNKFKGKIFLFFMMCGFIWSFFLPMVIVNTAYYTISFFNNLIAN